MDEGLLIFGAFVFSSKKINPITLFLVKLSNVKNSEKMVKSTRLQTNIFIGYFLKKWQKEEISL